MNPRALKHWSAYTSVPPPGPSPYEHLAHTLAHYSDPDVDRSRYVIQATSNVYGEGIETGLTIGDLFMLKIKIDLMGAELRRLRNPESV